MSTTPNTKQDGDPAGHSSALLADMLPVAESHRLWLLREAADVSNQPKERKRLRRRADAMFDLTEVLRATLSANKDYPTPVA